MHIPYNGNTKQRETKYLNQFGDMYYANNVDSAQIIIPAISSPGAVTDIGRWF